MKGIFCDLKVCTVLIRFNVPSTNGKVPSGVYAKNFSKISFSSTFLSIALPSLRFFIPQRFCGSFDHYCLFIKRKQAISISLGFVDNGNKLTTNVSDSKN
jgi:hypothetical protein